MTSGYDEIAQSLFSDGLSVVGNYELGEVIGKGIPRPVPLADRAIGSFGKVYLAYHTMTRTKVPIHKTKGNVRWSLRRPISLKQRD